jgi:Protein of unknown function (DUF3489)
MSKLTDTQLRLLSAASQRDDGLLVPPEHLKGGAAQKSVAKLLASNLVEEVGVKRDQPAWRDGDDGPIGLKITDAGLTAIGVEPAQGGSGSEQGKAGESTADAPVPSSSKEAAPRAGTKQALIVELLSRPEGAGIDDLTAATGWLPHTTRAALTGLRQKGYALAKSKGEDGRTIYRIELASPERTAAVESVG